MKKILVIGNGGREHIIVEKLLASPQKPEVFNFGTVINPGIKKCIREENIILGNILDMDLTAQVVKNLNPDFVFVGPDDPIGLGAVDACNSVGIPAFAPNKKCAQLESSKSFTRDLLAKYNIIGSPDFYVSKDLDDSQRKIFFEKWSGEIVVKADGLLGGKGVLVSGDHFDDFEVAENFAKKSIEKFGCVVLEQKLLGEEFSMISFVDGKTVLDTPAIQDHKRAYEDDRGPNTGGMGTISDENLSLPFLGKDDLKQAHQITLEVMKAIKQETGDSFQGLMYGGFMKTREGIRLIEYNARFGDPEVYNILSLLKNDLVEICEKTISGNLAEIGELAFEKKATVVKYLCPEGYPENPKKNVPIAIDFGFCNKNSQIYLGSVSEENGKYFLKGSRAVALLGIGEDLESALENCEKLISSVKGPVFFREDIGTKKLVGKRKKHLMDLGVLTKLLFFVFLN